MDDERLPPGPAGPAASEPPLPKLRPVEALPIEVDGQSVICLRDPSGLTDKVALVPRPVLAIVALLDGTRTAARLQAEFAHEHGELVQLADIATLVARLDEALLLETDRFRARRDQALAEYRAAPLRPAVHAHDSYPGDAPALRRLLDELFDSATPAPAGTAGSPDVLPIQGIVSPHIDFGRGGEVYAHAYRPLLDAPAPELYVVLGTDHHGDGALYAVTNKAFDTPLGPVVVDQDAVEQLGDGSGCFLESELNHLQEHSIEFQAVMLRYLMDRRGDPAPPVMLPILCGSFDRFISTGADPAADPHVEALRRALSDLRQRRRVVFIAAGDLAHVGPQFGDPEPFGEAQERALEADDTHLLGHIASGDPDRLFRHLHAERDGRRVCGLPPIYAMIQVLGGIPGDVRAYRQCPAGADGDSRVSVAALLFRGSHRSS